MVGEEPNHATIIELPHLLTGERGGGGRGAKSYDHYRGSPLTDGRGEVVGEEPNHTTIIDEPRLLTGEGGGGGGGAKSYNHNRGTSCLSPGSP